MDISLYFHIPFCRRRCGYCDFNTFAGMENLMDDYVKSLMLEVEKVLTSATETLDIHTVFFGGGTPSLLRPDDFEEIFEEIRRFTNLMEYAEITLEANPETVTMESISGYRKAGFNRISLGMQSASKFDLRALDRAHCNESLLNAIGWSRRAGFQNISLDLIFGIPGQTMESWLRTLRLALGLRVEHFSLYSLIVEEGTKLKHNIDRGLLAEIDEDLVADMYETAMDELAAAGYKHYEISNWARGDEFECRHNLQYWRYLPYLGFGAGAHGFFGRTRTENIHTVKEYIDAVKLRSTTSFPSGPAIKEAILLNKWEMMQENLMVSLRLTEEGVSLADFSERFGIELNQVFNSQINRLLHVALIEYFENGSRIRLTRRGRLLGNRVFSEFIGDEVPRGYKYLLDQ